MLMTPDPAADPTSCAQSRNFPRIDRPNSQPRRIAALATDKRGAQALEQAVRQGGDAIVVIGPDGDLPADDRPDLVIVVGASDGDVGRLPDLYDQAGRIGVLVTAVILADNDRPEIGPAVEAMRRNADLFMQTTDDDFLSLMLHWLSRPE